MANYTKTTIGKESRIELHEKLSLTGAEISLNKLPAGANVPFVHSHKENEEIYGILSGNGKAIIDGEEISLSTGDWLKITPTAKRQFFASDISLVDMGITPHTPTQNRTCAINAYGFSLYISYFIYKTNLP